MEVTQKKIDIINSKMNMQGFKGAEFFRKQDELEDLHEHYENQKNKYFNLEKQENDANRLLDRKSTSGPIDKIDYIFVTFKHSESSGKALEVFDNEWQIAGFFQSCCKGKAKQ